MLPEMKAGALLQGLAILIVLCLAVSRLGSETSTASYNTGYDDGYEEGYEKGYSDALEEYGIK